MSSRKYCPRCDSMQEVTHFTKNVTRKDGLQIWCKTCDKAHYTKQNPITNPTRMYVGGTYVPKSHPRYKAGNFKTWDDVLWDHPPLTSGEVYIITNPAFPQWVKVGLASESAQDRLRTYQTGDPYRSYQLDYSWRVGDCRAAEKAAHIVLKEQYKRKNEWFQCGVEQARLLIEGTMEEYA